MTITRNLELTERRCYACGRFYAVENVPPSDCPYCTEQARASLRGALTKAQKRAAR